MRLLIALTYYRPHVSGLSIYAERLARGLASRGHQVTVLTSRHRPDLAGSEIVGGVRVVRVPIALRLGKGVIMPSFALHAAAAIAAHDVVNIHMPQLEAAPLAFLGRCMRKGVVVAYHCDLKLPGGWLSRIVETGLAPLNRLALSLAHRVVASTDDYARHSPLLRRYAHKRATIAPPVDMPTASRAEIDALAHAWGLNGRPRIGFASRFAAEKGVEFLLAALPSVFRRVTDAEVVFSGAYKDTVGEHAYMARLHPLLEPYRDRLKFMDLLRDDEMAGFFALCSVLAVTSVNSTEAFGMVQVEAMLQGTPVVATDIPGVREPVRRTGMGEIVPPRNPDALADALVRVLQHRSRYVQPHTQVREAFGFEAALDRYEAVLGEFAPAAVANP